MKQIHIKNYLKASHPTSAAPKVRGHGVSFCSELATHVAEAQNIAAMQAGNTVTFSSSREQRVSTVT